MKPPSWNAKTRLLLTLELAVILPVAVLIGLSVNHLRHIERDKAVAAAIQRDFDQVLTISEKQINERAYDLIDDVRKQFPKPSAACSVTLDKILTAHPYAAHVFIYSPEGGKLGFPLPAGSHEGAGVSRGERKFFQNGAKLDAVLLP